MTADTLGPRTLSALRIALGLFFVLAGVAKLGAPDETTRIIAEHGIPGSAVMALAVGVGESCAGAMLFADLYPRTVAAALMVFLIPVIGFFHSPLGLSPGAAHLNAIALTMDIIVFIALAFVVRGPSRQGAPR